MLVNRPKQGRECWFALVHYTPFRALALIPALVSLVILAYAYLARRLAWVQCRPNHLHIQMPFCPLVVSYGRIKGVRPQAFAQVFDPAGERAARRRWLRLWFSPYLLAPDVTGFVFLVEDWMALSRQLDEFRTAWMMRRTEQWRAQSKT